MRFSPVLAIAAFFAALLPLAGNYAVHHPDEQYYTAAAIQMARSGDYLTPRDERGAPRFQKPILAYWLLAASYRLFGVSPFTSRLPFLLAGCAILAVAYAMSRDLVPDPAAARLALLALVAEPQLVFAALRSMPDVLLTLGLTLSAWGFLAVIAAERRARVYLAMAYGGAALAFLGKGLLGLVFVGFAVGFAWTERGRAGLKALVSWPPMVGAALVATAWLLLAWHAPQGEGLRVFFGDQIARRFVDRASAPFIMIPAFLGSYVAGFLPWSGPAARMLARGATADASRRRLRFFIAAWCVLLAALFGCAREPEEHYVLPAVPLLAVLLGDVMANAGAELRERCLRPSLGVSLACVLFLGASMMWAQMQVGASLGARLWLLALLVLAAIVGAAGLRRRRLDTATSLALLVLLVFPMLGAAMFPVALPEQGEQLAARLAALGIADRRVLVVGPFGTAGKLRVAAGGALEVRRVDALDSNAIPENAAVVVPRELGPRLAENGYEIHAGSSGYRRLDVVQMLRAVGRGELGSFLAANRTELVIAVRRAP